MTVEMPAPGFDPSSTTVTISIQGGDRVLVASRSTGEGTHSIQMRLPAVAGEPTSAPVSLRHGLLTAKFHAVALDPVGTPLEVQHG